MFSNCEIDHLLNILQNYCKTDVEYVYSLYDTSYANRPSNPSNICFIIPSSIDFKNVQLLLHHYNVKKECCEGIGEIIEITKKI